uniref:TAFH domain-containing protein n=1 Tax=Panagrellus redivivus TaxID=6233 RepID=A0A7E4UZ89_PANRE
MNPPNQQRRVSSQEYAQQEQVQQFHSQHMGTPVYLRGNVQAMNVQRIPQQHVMTNIPMHRNEHQMGSGHMIYAQHQVQQGQQHQLQQPRAMNPQTTIMRGMPSQQQMRQSTPQQQQRPNSSQQQQQMQRPPTPQLQHQMQQQMQQRPQTPVQHQMQMQQSQQPMQANQMQQGQQPMQASQIQQGQQQMQHNQQQMQQNQQQMQQMSQQQQIQRSQTPQQQAQGPQTPQNMMPPPRQPAQQQAATPQSANSNSNLSSTQVQDVNKLGRLLRTTIILAGKQSPEKMAKMASYVSQLIHSELTESEFAIKLTETVGHSPQQKLLEFFESALPYLRTEILSGRLPIDSVIKVPVATPSLNDSNSHGSPASFHGPSPQLSTTPSVSSPMSRHLVEPGSEPAHQPRANIPFSPLTQPPASAPTLDPTSSTASAEGQQQPTQQILYHANTGVVGQQPQVAQFLVPHPPQQNHPQVVISQPQMVQLVQQPIATSSAQIPEFQPVVEQMDTSEPDQPTLINSAALAEMLTKNMPGGAIEEGVVRLLSDCVEARIRALLLKASEAAEARLFSHRNNSNFVEIDDPRSQLRFVQKYEGALAKRRLEAEKEKELSSKPKGKSKDLDALEKAKQEKEAYLHQEANAAANAALGIKRRRIADDSADSDLASRLRKHIITQKDLVYVFENDRHCRSTLVYQRTLYGLDEDGNPFQ